MAIGEEIVPGIAYLRVMVTSMARILLLAILPALVMATAVGIAGDRDDALVGKWRAQKPEGPDDNEEVWEFRFDKKGKAAVFRVMYAWDADNQSWAPATADQPAQGDNDEWTTERKPRILLFGKCTRSFGFVRTSGDTHKVADRNLKLLKR